MARLEFVISAAGLEAAVVVGPSGKELAALHAAGQPIPRPVHARGLIDTGTSVTAISATVLQQTGLIAIGTGQSHTASGKVPVGIFEVSLSILPLLPGSTGHIVLPDLVVSELSAALPDCDVLIGMDVLAQCRLFVDGPAAEFFLEH